MPSEFLIRARKVARQQQLEREKMVGRPRSKSWGGKPSAKAARRQAKRECYAH